MTVQQFKNILCAKIVAYAHDRDIELAIEDADTGWLMKIENIEFDKKNDILVITSKGYGNCYV